MTKRIPLISTFSIVSIFALNTSFAQVNDKNEKKLPRIIKYNPDLDTYQELLNGEDDSVIFYTGLVTIAPNEHGDLHSTKNYEEIIITLEGNGEVRLDNSTKLNIKYGAMAYIPQQTNHHVYNTGEKPLKYIYVAVKSK